MNLDDRAGRIRLLVFDVDGVLTGGQILFGRDGEMLKMFNVHDGLGINAARRAGLVTAVVTGRKSEMVERRCAELAIDEVCQGIGDKAAVVAGLAQKHALALTEACYIGDDLNDLAAMAEVGLACAVADAVPEVRAAAHYVASRQGGCGAVREIIEMVLKTQGKWDKIVAAYSRPGPTDIKQ